MIHISSGAEAGCPSLSDHLSRVEDIVGKISKMLPPFASERMLNWHEINYMLRNLKGTLDALARDITSVKDITHRHLCRFETIMESFIRCKRQRINGRTFFLENKKYSEVVRRSSEMTTMMIKIAEALEEHHRRVIVENARLSSV